MKKIVICSHERSGTHFLIDTISSNFLEYRDGSSQRVDLDYRQSIDPGWTGMYCDPDQMRYCLSHDKFGKDIDGKFIQGIFKSHHPYEFFEPIHDYLLDNFAVFYIARDGRDVMTSFWRHAWTAPIGLVPRAFTVGQFMRLQPYGIIDRYHGKATPHDMIDRWNKHIVSWLYKPIAGVCYVSFEQLKNDFGSTVARIAKHLSLDVPERPRVPPLAGVTPWKGEVGSWREFFTESDEEFFWSCSTYEMQLLETQYGSEYIREVFSRPGRPQPSCAE